MAKKDKVVSEFTTVYYNTYMAWRILSATPCSEPRTDPPQMRWPIETPPSFSFVTHISRLIKPNSHSRQAPIFVVARHIYTCLQYYSEEKPTNSNHIPP